MSRARARSRMASTLSDAARALPPKERIEFRAFLRRLKRGEDTGDIRLPKKGTKHTTRARKRRQPTQGKLL